MFAMGSPKTNLSGSNTASYRRPNFAPAAGPILFPEDKAFPSELVHSEGIGEPPALRAPRKELEF